MPLTPGVRLGPYEVLAPIGAGGMGEVYRARDTRLDRAVAIKILPPHLAADGQLRDRFDREARAISSLSHPHICALFDVGREESPAGSEQAILYIVMELLDGQTLAERLISGPLPPDEALRYAIQIVGALDLAHRSGIVHRDLKPANVMLTRSGAKLLDFGLAKGATPVVALGDGSRDAVRRDPSPLSMMPTTPAGLTAQGTILGTFQYMAPEQIEGIDADVRTDIFAFGALVFEMLTGRPAFEGKTRASLLGAILKDEPPRVSSIQPLAPTALDRIVATCLAKDPDDRWQSARDLLHEMTWVASGANAKPAMQPMAAPRRSSLAAWSVASALGVALLAAAVVVVRHIREAPQAVEAIQFTIPAPENLLFGGPASGGTGTAAQVAVSPDGRLVVFVAGSGKGYQLWLRQFGAIASRPIAGTEDAAFPFWSPDSRFVGFFATGKLKKVQVAGGPPIVLCDAGRGLGGTWNRDNLIVFGHTPDSGGSVLLRVSGNGGVPVGASVLDKTTGETSHRWPHFLPDGHHFLYTAATGTCCPPQKPAAIRVGALDSTESVTLFQAESSVAYGSGHLLFWRDGTLMAERFDPDTRQVKGDPFPVADEVGSEGTRYASFSVSPSGVMVYGGTARATTRLTWFDRAGNTTGVVGEPANYSSLALAPDERRVAVSLSGSRAENRAIWTIDSARGGLSRLTFDTGDDTSPVWSPDGSRIAFHAVRPGDSSLRQKLVSGTVNDETLLPGSQLMPSDWSADGRFIAYTRSGNAGSPDIWILPLSGDGPSTGSGRPQAAEGRKPFAFTQTPFGERNGAFAPNGQWIAYESNETGQTQVYVQPFPSTGGQFLISKSGGRQPTWRGDGKELFFMAPDSRIMAAAIDTTRQFAAGVPQVLFSSAAPAAVSSRQYAVSRDGKRFLVNERRDQSSATPLTVVVNWLSAVQK